MKFWSCAKSGYRQQSLDAINFFLANVRGVFGPYLIVFLITQEHWSPSQVGFVGAIAALVGLLAQTPVGAVLDVISAKRGAIILAISVLTASAVLIFAAPTFWPVMVASLCMAVVSCIFAPAVAALTLGLTARTGLATRIARNAAFEHAGNVAIALLAGAVGSIFSQREVFLLAPLGAIFATSAVLSIPSQAINHDRARGLETQSNDEPTIATATTTTSTATTNTSTATTPEPAPPPTQPTATHASNLKTGCTQLLQNRAFVAFCICSALFHFANAPLLPLVGQKLAVSNPKAVTAMMSFCIITAQLIMLPMALFVGRHADEWGRKPLFLVAFIVLPIRSILYAFTNDTFWLITIQLLDGVAAGIISTLTPLTVADMTRGSSHFNLAQGIVATIQGVGIALSCLAAGMMVDYFKFNAAFIALGFAALVALVVLYKFMPETKDDPAPTLMIPNPIAESSNAVISPNI